MTASLRDQAAPLAYAADEDALDTRDSADEVFNLRGRFCGANAMNVRPSVNREGDSQPIGATRVHSLHHGQRRRTPVKERGSARHHHGVHRQRILFNHFGQRGKIARKNRSPATFQSPRRAGDACRLKRAGFGDHVAFSRAGGLVRRLDDGDHIAQVPMFRRRDRSTEGAIVLVTGIPLYEPAWHAAAGRPGSAPRKFGKLVG